MDEIFIYREDTFTFRRVGGRNRALEPRCSTMCFHGCWWSLFSAELSLGLRCSCSVVPARVCRSSSFPGFASFPCSALLSPRSVYSCACRPLLSCSCSVADTSDLVPSRLLSFACCLARNSSAGLLRVLLCALGLMCAAPCSSLPALARHGLCVQPERSAPPPASADCEC